MIPVYPAHILACTSTMALILRAQAGQLPQGDYFAAWDGLENPDAYNPTEETRTWLQTHWYEVVQPPGIGPLASAPAATIKPLPAPAVPPVLSESWMADFLGEYVRKGAITKAAKFADVSRATVHNRLNADVEFARAFEDAKEERKDLIRATIGDRALEGTLEPVIGSIGDYRDGQLTGPDGQPLFIRKYDNRLLIRYAESCVEEYAKTKPGGDTNINVQANAAASANASTAVVTPEKLKDLQRRARRQLEKQMERAEQERLRKGLPAKPTE